MSFNKITSTITIVPFDTYYLDTLYKYETDQDVKRIIKDKIKTNPIQYMISKLNYSYKSNIIGYYDSGLVMFDDSYNMTLISTFITGTLPKSYNKFVLFKSNVIKSDICAVMGDLIRQDMFNIESTDMYQYQDSSHKEPLYISYVSSFETD